MGQGIVAQPRRIPLVLKLVYTAFVAVLVPVYWDKYTPVNFLFFCDVALLVTLAALWLESAYLASMMAVAITLPQLLWQVDFLSYLALRVHFPIDLTGYMFDPEKLLFLRGLSFFHFWLPILLVWLVWRLGYNRRAFWSQIVFSCLILLLSYAFTTYPTGPAGNVNKVLGMGGDNDPPQTWMAPQLWLGVVMLAMPVLIYLPTHLLFLWVFPHKASAVGETQTGEREL